MRFGTRDKERKRKSPRSNPYRADPKICVKKPPDDVRGFIYFLGNSAFCMLNWESGSKTYIE